MKRRNKALIYVSLAMLTLLGEHTAVWATRKVWPDEFEAVALAVALAATGLLQLKGYYSDPTERPTEKGKT